MFKIKTIIASALPLLVLTGCAVRGQGDALTWTVTVPTVSFNVPTITVAAPVVTTSEVAVEPAVEVAAPEVAVEPAVEVAPN